MHSTLQSLVHELDRLAVTLDDTITSSEPFAIAHGDWALPLLTKHDLAAAARTLAAAIRERGADELGVHEQFLSDYVHRLSYLQASTVPNLWNSSGKGVSAYLLTLDGLSKALAPALVVARDDAALANVSRTARRLRTLEVRLSDVEPRFGGLAEMVARVDEASQLALRLQTEFEALVEARDKVAALLKSAEADYASITRNKVAATDCVKSLSGKEEEASAVLKHCQSAYAADTSQGLAAAFAERSADLATSMWVWTAALVIALMTGAYFGTQRVSDLVALLRIPNISSWALAINLLLAALSVAAPIWFGWLATKQINHRFRLSEDYAFKASVSRAYEGYRREAARHESDMEAKLLASALARFDEQPLRLVPHDSHGSPWHELASSASITAALSNIPGFAKEVIDLARTALHAKSGQKAE